MILEARISSLRQTIAKRERETNNFRDKVSKVEEKKWVYKRFATKLKHLNETLKLKNKGLIDINRGVKLILKKKIESFADQKIVKDGVGYVSKKE